jgi:hypothetical protein
MKSTMTAITLLAGAILVPGATYAEEPDARVARVSYVSGDVSYQRGDDEGWNDVRVNTPLVTGDAFYAPEGARAEVDLGSGIVIRVDGGTEVQLVNNSADVAQLGLSNGVMDLSVRTFPSDFTLELDTPTGAATILEPGRYRVDVDERGTRYSVIEGTISLAVDGEQLDVREGESLELEDTDPPTYGYDRLSGGTPFDSWADDRDARWERSSSARYVNNDVVGYEDLDDHGTWRDSRDYGRVWVPSRIHAGWAPYQEGRWIWQDPFGWTWVSYEPWGWAPYHYGRWVYLQSSWCWVPPPPRGYRGPTAVMAIQPVYAPALVAFVGGSNWGMSLSVGGPAIGWVPLAPRERYYYPWQPAPRVVINNYTNISVTNAVTVVNYNTFRTGAVRPIPVDRAQIIRAPVMGFTATGITPTRASLTSSPEARPQPRAAPRPSTQRTLVARLVPPPKPQPFAQKVSVIEKTGAPVSRPVAAEPSVGKPFAPGVRARAGVKSFAAPAPAGRTEMKARPGAETRAPKKIERDISPPVPVAPSGRRERPRGPTQERPAQPEAAPAPTRSEPPPRHGRPEAPPPVTPAPPARPEATPAPTRSEPPPRHGRPEAPPPMPTPAPTPRPEAPTPVPPPAPPERIHPAPPRPEPAPQPTPQPTRPPDAKKEHAPAPKPSPEATPPEPKKEDPESTVGQPNPNTPPGASKHPPKKPKKNQPEPSPSPSPEPN